MGWLSGYLYRKKITVQSAQVAGSGTHSAFPVYIPIAGDTDIGGHITDTDTGHDLRFTSGNGTTELYYQRVAFAVAAGACTARYHVNYSIGTGANTVLYVYYGKSGAADGESVDATWNPNYVAVYHAEEALDGSPNEFIDSSGNANHGVASGVTGQDAGKLGYGVLYDTAADAIDCGSGATLDDVAAKTIEFWAYIETKGTDNNYGAAVDKGFSAGWHVGMKNDAAIMRLIQSFSVTDGYWRWPVPSGAWCHISIGYDCSSDANDPTVRVNGSTVTVTEDVAPEGDASSDAAEKLWVGNITGGERTFDGTLDEIRISNVVRSDGWRETSYNNQNAPGDFLAWGGEEAFVRIPMAHYRRRRMG